MLVDTRSDAEFAAGTIPGALHIPVQRVDPSKGHPAFRERERIVVFGRDPGDGRPMALAKRLIVLEKDPVLLFGGFAAWKDAGLRVTTPSVRESIEAEPADTTSEGTSDNPPAPR